MANKLRSLLFLLVFLLLAAPYSSGKVVEEKSITREADPVIVTGNKLMKFLGKHKDKLRLYARKDGDLIPIPYQIDELTPEDEYAFTNGEEAVEDTDKGLIDDNDELVFMARDTGERVSPESWPPGNLGGMEIEVIDSLNGNKGWAYLLEFPEPPERSEVDYISMDLSGGIYRIKARNYCLDNAEYPPNAFRPTVTLITPAAGGDNTDIYDSPRQRTTVSVLFFTVHKDEKDIKTKITAFIDGPVRIINKNEIKLRLFWRIWVPTPGSVTKLYYSHYDLPTNLHFPIALDKKASTRLRVSFDLVDSAIGYKFYNSHNPIPVVIDGVMSPEEKALNLSYPDWNVVTGNHGTQINRFTFPQRLLGKDHRLYYMDDSKLPDPPEMVRGQIGHAGFDVDLTGAKSGVYPLVYHVYYPEDFEIGDEVNYLNILDHPLAIVVR
ncbi:MAG: hypothetical protein JSU92_14940 [Deltaproteobacteria bacterium]|nr:MAG: hypothetical protein JSU92_14940 [Deltaproteobacteria bacterium]